MSSHWPDNWRASSPERFCLHRSWKSQVIAAEPSILKKRRKCSRPVRLERSSCKCLSSLWRRRNSRLKKCPNGRPDESRPAAQLPALRLRVEPRYSSGNGKPQSERNQLMNKVLFVTCLLLAVLSGHGQFTPLPPEVAPKGALPGPTEPVV